MSPIKLKKTEVKHVAQLAQLKLSGKEIEKFQKQLSEILGFISQLKKLETDKIVPTSQTTGLNNIFRKDKPRPSFFQEEVLANAPQKEKGFFKVKALFEKR